MDITCNKVLATCRCGEKMALHGTYTQLEFPVETCHKCHPAYTGQKLKHAAGSIDKFTARYDSFGLDSN